ncbi:MAG: glycosyltransferase family 2 protein [bacterium]
MVVDLSIIIVNYNGGHELLSCLNSIKMAHAELVYEVIVVDNGSTDGSLERAKSDYPEFRFLSAGTNLGFAAACNLGLAGAQGRHAMLLNPDTEVLQGTLTCLVGTLDANPAWGIVGPRMVDQEGRIYSAARRFPTPWRLFCEDTRLTYLFPRSKLFASYIYGDRDIRAVDDVDQIEGSALVISGRAREVVGDLDPRFFLFFEEVDWCRRVRQAGFEIRVVQNAEVRHMRSTTMRRYFLEARLARAKSAMMYFQKYYGAKGLKQLRRWMRIGLWIREWEMRMALLLGTGERARIRAEAARCERALYHRGLQA